MSSTEPPIQSIREGSTVATTPESLIPHLDTIGRDLIRAWLFYLRNGAI
jgi:hypothetical protein